MSSPFNEEKYKRLLEGLEISEVWLNDVLNGVETFRLDAEYHAKEYERIENFVKNNPERFSKFSNWSVGIDCSAFYPGVEPLYGTGDIPLIRVQNVKEEIEYDNCVTLPILSSDYDTLKFVNPGDIVITKGGSIGFVGYVTKRAYASRDLMFINSSQLEERERVFLYLYLSTDFSFKQLIRSSSQCAQPHLTITLVKNFDIFLPNESLKDKCLSLYQEYSDKHIKSKHLYSEAEELLLKELGLKDWQPNNNPVNIKQLKESFLASGRLDAEYYQSKYDEIEKIIKTHHYDILDNLCLLINHGMQPPYIEDGTMRVFSQKWIKDKEIDYSFIDDINEPRTSEDFAQLNPDYVCRKFDIVHYSVGANIGYCHTYLSDVPMMPGSFITLIRANEDKIDPIYLGVVLNSIIGRIQSEKRKSGTAQPYVYPKDIKEFLIPILPKPIQDTISAKIQESFALKAESKRLLEEAKIMVEKEIEKGGE